MQNLVLMHLSPIAFHYGFNATCPLHTGFYLLIIYLTDMKPCDLRRRQILQCATLTCVLVRKWAEILSCKGPCRSPVVQGSSVRVHSVLSSHAAEGDPSGREGGRQWKRECQREGEMGSGEQWGGDKTAACSHPTFYSSVNPFVWRVLPRLCGIVGGWCLNSASSPSFRTNPGGFIITLVTNHHFPMIVAGVSPRNLLVFCFWAANSLLSEHLCCFYDSLLV